MCHPRIIKLLGLLYFIKLGSMKLKIILNVIFSDSVFCMGFVSQLGHYAMDSLENSSILHVLILIFLRLNIIMYPLSRKGPLNFRKVLVIAIWIVPLITKLPFLFLWEYPFYHFLYHNIQFHAFSTVPIILIVCLYGVMLLTIKRKKREHQKVLKRVTIINEKDTDGKTTTLLTGLVFVLLVCYLPYLVHWSVLLKDHVLHFTESTKRKSACNKILNHSLEVP